MTFKFAMNRVPKKNLRQYPAINAWLKLHPERKVPQRIQILERSGPSRIVLRLTGIGNSGSNVIAKRTPQNTALIEREIYEEILPKLPLPMLQYYGSAKEERSKYYWLFLEDVSGEKYNPDIIEHRLAAAKWFGIMNTSVFDCSVPSNLPKRWPEHYLELLIVGRNTILSNISNLLIQPGDLSLLETVVNNCDHLSYIWEQIASVCEGIPPTLVHGDFITKNVGIRSNHNGITLLPFDWEKAGWGNPAEDISRVDIPTYWDTVKDVWPELSLQAFERLANVGKVFRCLVYLDWIAPQLKSDSLEQSMYHLGLCNSWLDDLIRTAPWRE